MMNLWGNFCFAIFMRCLLTWLLTLRPCYFAEVARNDIFGRALSLGETVVVACGRARCLGVILTNQTWPETSEKSLRMARWKPGRESEWVIVRVGVGGPPPPRDGQVANGSRAKRISSRSELWIARGKAMTHRLARSVQNTPETRFRKEKFNHTSAE